jgi:hypothetical protein
MQKRHSRFLVIWLFSMLYPCIGFGQYFIWGQDPGSLKWKQIRTENFQVIFPEGYEEQGAYIADALEFAYLAGSRTLGHQPRKVSVIIHNQTVVSNGFVSWAPRRLEMFTNPPQDNDSHDWLEQLVVHEFRHVVQVDKLNQGVTKLLSLIMGEQATGAVFGIFVPMWFAEGDAVAVETGLSQSGRGRLPFFEQGLRTQVLEKGLYSYDKAFLGSYKDFVPNYYELGYQLVAAGRVKYGEDIWDKVVTNVGRRPYTIMPFSLGLKKYAGVTSEQHYRQTFEMLDAAWRQQGTQQNITPHSFINPPKELFTNYRYPAFVNDSTLVALKTGLKEIPKVVAFDRQGHERVLFSPGLFNVHGFSAGAGKVVWSEQRTDPRWEHRSWSEIHVYDMVAGKRERITRRTRYFAPAISPNGKMIAVAEVTEQNHYSLVVINTENGERISTITTNGNDFLMTPAWHPDNRTLVAVALDEKGKRIVFADIFSNDLKTIFHAGHTEISRPSFTQQGDVLFTGSFSGLEKVYLLYVETGQVVQAVGSAYGARDAVVEPGTETIYWSEYTAQGYALAKSEGSPVIEALPLEKVEDLSVKFHEIISDQEGALVTKSNIIRSEWEIEPYYKFPGLFNLHSWSPMYIDANNMEVNPGFALYFQDILSTSVAVLGYDYDMNEEVGTYSIDYNYQGWYPVVNFNAGTGLRRARYTQNNVSYPFFFRENTLKVGLSLPLTFRRYEWFYGVTPSTRLAFTKAKGTDSSPSFFQENDIRSLEYRLFAYRQQRSVARDMRPRWAQIADLNYRHTPLSGADMGSVFSARIIGFFPGLLRHHSLRLSAAWQEKKAGTPVQGTVNYSFPNLIAYPRGITGRNDHRVSVLSADYAFPVMYPDLSLPKVIYLKRVSANLFIDRADTKTLISPAEEPSYYNQDVLYSFGADLIGNMHFFRFISPIDLGVRMYFLPETQKAGFQMLFGINF